MTITVTVMLPGRTHPDSVTRRRLSGRSDCRTRRLWRPGPGPGHGELDSSLGSGRRGMNHWAVTSHGEYAKWLCRLRQEPLVSHRSRPDSVRLSGAAARRPGPRRARQPEVPSPSLSDRVYGTTGHCTVGYWWPYNELCWVFPFTSHEEDTKPLWAACPDPKA